MAYLMVMPAETSKSFKNKYVFVRQNKHETFFFFASSVVFVI